MNLSSRKGQTLSGSGNRKNAVVRFFTIGLCICVGLVGLRMQGIVYPYYADSSLLLPEMRSNSSDAKSQPLRIDSETCRNKRGTNAVLERDEILRTVQRMYQEANNPKEVRFEKFGQALLEKALALNRYLVTVQVGAMNGVSNDPLYEMFVGRRRPMHYNLSNWIPLAIEPVPANFENLQKTYQRLKTDRDLACPYLLQGAVAYGSEDRSCTFCRFDVDSKLEKCAKHPDWMKYQIGTLDCAYSRRFFGDNFNDCIIQGPVPCAPIDELMEQRKLPPGSMAMLQIDIEGYEAILIPNFLKDKARDDLPPIIHFEHKVMAHLDKKNGTTTRRMDTDKELERYGYSLFDQGEDTLALLLERKEK